MKSNESVKGCPCCSMTRRDFLAAGCAACAGAAGLLATPTLTYAAEGGAKLRLRIVYALHAEKQPSPDWPNIGFDFAPVMERFNTALTEAIPNLELLSCMATGQEQAEKILADDKNANIDGYIVYQMNAWNRVVQTIATSGKPVLYADFQYGGSGGFLVYTADFLRKKAANVGFVASSNVDDFVAAVKCFDIVKKGGSVADFVAATAKIRKDGTPKSGNMVFTEDHLKPVSTEKCIRKMKESKILAIRDQKSGPASPYVNIPVEMLAFAELNAAWEAADKDKAKAVADRWQKSAAVVDGVSRETLENSAAMYLGMKAVLKKHHANAITVNCLGGFYGGHIHAYPCLGFHELCNEGLIGACECDVRSTATMVTLNALTGGRPGYISDPVIDTSKNQIIYAHCVASKLPFGPKGPKNPFEILTHSEDRQGASVRSILPLGYKVTTIEMGHDGKEILFHQGKAVANDPDDRACRTKLAAEPIGDIEKLFTMWDQWSWHRVTAYGDLKDAVFALADAIGYKVVEEA